MATPPTISPPGSIHKLTHRTTQGEFLLRPDRFVTENFFYLLGYMQSLYSVKLHLATILSNHLHLLLTDVLGDQMGKFNTHFFSLAARGVNAFRGRRENLFNSDGVNDVMICSHAEDLVDHGAYISANTVEAGLVSHAKKWPGINIRPSQMGNLCFEVEKPDRFYDPEGELPDMVTVEFTIPKASDCKPEELRQRMAEEHNRREEEKRRQMEDDGKQFLGRKAILRKSPFARPQHELEMFARVPHVACKDEMLRIQMLEWRKKRNRKYRLLLQSIREGTRSVILPIGTLLMHFRHGFDRDPWQGCLWEMLAADT